MVSRRDTCGMARWMTRLAMSAELKTASFRPYLFKSRMINCASSQNAVRISRAPRSSLAQIRITASVSWGRRNACSIASSLLLTEHPLEDGCHMLEVVVEVEGFADLGLAQRPDAFLIPQQFGQEVGALFPDLHGIALDQPVGILAGYA